MQRPRRILIPGTLAIDYACDYPGVFSALPQHRGINLSVQLDRIERRFGGCAMNIAYTLKLLGDEPVPFVFVGRDFGAAQDANGYAAHLSALGMDTSGVNMTDTPYSSHGFIFTDREHNQFTGFFGNQAELDFEQRLRAFAAEGAFDYAILAPDAPAKMIAAAHVMRNLDIPFLTDPGQNVSDFTAADAAALVQASTALIVNEFEYRAIERAVGTAVERLDLAVVTLGAQGVRWRSRHAGNGTERAVEATVVDPTGCGDAFRAGFVHALLRDAALRDAIRAGTLAASAALQSAGAQTHDCDDFALRYRTAWQDSPAWLGESEHASPSTA